MEIVQSDQTKKVWIPEVPTETIRELAKHIKPIVRFVKGFPYFIKQVDLFGVAYTWSPKPTKRAYRLEAVCDIKTYHSFGYPGFFKPSIAEVLAQIPERYLDKVVAFEIVESPTHAEDLNREKEALNAGYHVAVTRLYSKK